MNGTRQETVIDLCSSSSSDEEDDERSQHTNDNDGVECQEEYHESSDDENCNSPPLLKGPIHRMNELAEQQQQQEEEEEENRKMKERLISSSASSNNSSDVHHHHQQQQPSTPTAQRIVMIRSVKSTGGHSNTEKQPSLEHRSPSVKLLESLKPFLQTDAPKKDLSNEINNHATATSPSSSKNEIDHNDPPSVEEVASHVQHLSIDYCWSCDSKIYPNDGDLVCEHPLLGVTACSLCADKAYIVEDEVKTLLTERKTIMMQPNIHEQEMEICSWCADEDHQDEQLFLCDDCPRVFCAGCVKKSHGEQNGEEMIQTLMEHDDRWTCPACSPTPLIEQLRQLFLESDTDGKGGDKLNGKNISTSEDGDESEVQKLLDKLGLLEDELEEITERLETEYLDKLRKDIQEELQDDDEIEEEMNTFIQLNENRYSNVSDAIGIIHDELEAKDVDLTAFYKIRQNGDTVVDHVESEWKIEVDKLLDKRDEDENRQKGYAKGADGYKGDDFLYRDFEDLDASERKVDELCTTEEAIEILESIAKKKGDSSVIRNFRDKALRNDDWDLEELRVKTVHHSDLGDKIKDRKSSVTGTKMSSTNTLIVSRRRYPLNLKKANAKRYSVKKEQKMKRSCSPKAIVNREPSKKRKVVPLFLSGAKGKQEKADEYGSKTKTFDDSNCILGSVGDKRVSVASSLAAKLKSHQIDGCQFMWNQVFGDITNTKPHNTVKSGCILAHNMGLGKSLQIIALVHTILTNPVLKDDRGDRRFSAILLVVPVNTLANWCNEFNKWTVDVPKIRLFDFNSSGNQSGRRNVAQRWRKDGGILIISFDTLASIIKDDFFADVLLTRPDVVILDEAHLMLKNSSSLISKALSKVATPRKIALTGTPLQNNLMEYFRIINWVRPGCIGSEQEFEKKYMKVVDESLRSDASANVQLEGEKLVQDLTNSISDFVHRLDSSVLENDLPPIKQVVLHVRRTRVQSKLYQAFKRYRALSNRNNFLLNFSKLFPVNNHPGVLLKTFAKETKTNESDNKKPNAVGETLKIAHDALVAQDAGKESQTSCEVIVIDDSDSEDEGVVEAVICNQQEEDGDISMEDDEDKDVEWWTDLSKKFDFNSIEHGGKVILLLQLLAHAELIGDKVIVFSQCLRTLSFIEDCLQIPNWEKTVETINQLSPGRSWGGWKPGVDYMRLDGSTSSADRDKLIKRFNSKPESHQVFDASSNNVKLFLISVRAGGVGTNLVAANRVVLFDSSWNPAVDYQAIYRCYRYGQTKPVYAYRFLTDDTMEQKVYSRIVNKTAIAARVIDKKQPQRNFTSRELDDILAIDSWVQCDDCEKWRMLPPWVEPPGDEDTWTCKENIFDPKRSICSAKERDAKFYNRFFDAQVTEQQQLLQNGDNSKLGNQGEAQVTEQQQLLQNGDNSKLGNQGEAQVTEQQHLLQNGDNSIVEKQAGETLGETQISAHVSEQNMRESGADADATVEDVEKIENTKKDVILTKLLEIPAPSAPGGKLKNKKNRNIEFKALVTKYYYHDSLMKEATKSGKSDTK